MKKVTKKENNTELSAAIYTSTGKEKGTINLPSEIFGLPWNGDLVHQVAIAMQANARPTVADTKDRSEVRGGGKKPWKQKGTGRSRHGSSRSPIWRKGGVTHGPLAEKDYSQKINKKMRVKALFTVLSQKLSKGKVIFVDDLSLKSIKTKDANAILINLAEVPEFGKLIIKRKNAALIALSGRDTTLLKSFKNIPQVACDQLKDINVLDVLNKEYVIIPSPQTAVEYLGTKLK